jgi:hypothetical protein
MQKYGAQRSAWSGGLHQCAHRPTLMPLSLQPNRTQPRLNLTRTFEPDAYVEIGHDGAADSVSTGRDRRALLSSRMVASRSMASSSTGAAVRHTRFSDISVGSDGAE